MLKTLLESEQVKSLWALNTIEKRRRCVDVQMEINHLYSNFVVKTNVVDGLGFQN